MESARIDSFPASFSLHEVSKPKFAFDQVRAEADSRVAEAGVPKPFFRLVVGRNGKITRSKI